MWTPTHAQVTVHRARNLVPKGKGGTNDAYVTIQLGKDKYQTSVKERTENPEWHEECDMFIGNAKEVHLNVFHRSFLGLDDFLGSVSLPLEQFQIYERPRSRWYALKGRPGKKGDTKYRGEIECKVTFVVQSKSTAESSETLRRAGSIKNLANTVTEKLKLPVRSSSFKDKDDGSKKKKAFIEPLMRSPSDIGTIREQTEPEPDPKLTPLQMQNRQLSFSEADLNRSWRNSDSHKKTSSDEIDGMIRHKQPLYKAPLLKRNSDSDAKTAQKEKAVDVPDVKQLKDSREMTKSLSRLDEQVEVSEDLRSGSAGEKCRTSLGNVISESIPEETTTPEIPTTDVILRPSRPSMGNSKDVTRRHTLQYGADNIEVATHELQKVTDYPGKSITISPELLDEYRGITREELITLVHTQKNALYTRDMYIRDLESYIDNLLVRVMENTPRILQNPFRWAKPKSLLR